MSVQFPLGTSWSNNGITSGALVPSQVNGPLQNVPLQHGQVQSYTYLLITACPVCHNSYDIDPNLTDLEKLVFEQGRICPIHGGY